MSIYSQYTSQEEYKAAFKKRDAFGKENDYEVYDWNICFYCMNFMVDLHHPHYGGYCKCMEQAGAFSHVLANAVCNKFLSCKGQDLNNKPVVPAQWPKWVHIKEKWGKKKEFVLLGSDFLTCNGELLTRQ
jgi:hypothetical protein